MTRHTRFRAAILLAVTLVVVLAAAAVSAEEPEGTIPAGEALDPRIVGGVEVDPPGKYPFIVALVFADEPDTYWGQYCAGTLLDPWWVMTAGHCVSFGDANRASEIDVVVGRHDLRNGTDGERIGVADIVRHPGYDNKTLANDVALLRLERAATAGTPVLMANTEQLNTFLGSAVEATVIGWGATLGNPPGTPNYPDTLREVQVPMVSDVDCAAAYGSDLLLPDQICAGDLVNGGVDSCFGDSGGPLFFEDGGTFYQIGIVSTGNECALPGFPGIYTRVPYYMGWAFDTMTANPVPACNGHEATVLGSIWDDVLVGTEGDDVIFARSGADTITGLGGADLVCAGPGADWIDAGDGDDVVLGGPGDDHILGGLGNDVLGGYLGNDHLFGGEGHDRLLASMGDDLAMGEAGDDLLRGGGGIDHLLGGDGNDIIIGFPGDDTLSGGLGDDKLVGSDGFDILRGGLGLDVCYTGEDVICELP